MNIEKYLNELRRRNVFKSALAYLVVAWLITQVSTTVLSTFDAPDYIAKTIISILFIGFPLWLVFSWIYEFTPDGIKKTEYVEPESSIMIKTGSRINKVTTFALSLAVIILVIDRFTRKPVNVLDYGDKAIAVMAFADMSPNQDQEYFSDGISEELLNILVRIPDLKVISRTSSFSYKDKNVTATEIGNELNVSHILEGSIRKAGNTIRITAQLINTNDGSHVWSHTYDRDLDSIFVIQDEIAGEVSQQLQLSLLGRSDRQNPPVTEAYNLYLQARHLVHQNTKESYILAEEIVKQSIAIDSSYSDAWDLLGNIYDTGTYNFSIGDTQESISKGIAATLKAIELDPNSAYAFATLSSLQYRTWKFDDAEKSMKKALGLEPNNSVIIGTAGLKTFGDLEKSIELIQKAIKLDPLVYTNYFNLGFTYLRLSRYVEAIEAFNNYAIYYPNSQILHYMRAMIFLAQGKNDEALVEIDKETHEFFNLYGKNFILYALGGDQQSETVFKEYVEKFSESDPANMADLLAFRGDYEASFSWLDRALEKRDPVLLEALTYPAFKPMREDPRWDAIIDQLGLPDNNGFLEAQ